MTRSRTLSRIAGAALASVAALGLSASELAGDNFAGGGGASVGIKQATGREPDFAINHDDHAVAIHSLNHPGTRHYCQSMQSVMPLEVTGGRPVGMLWFSPDCTHFSKAKGQKPRSAKIRGLAWEAVRWASIVRQRVFFLENVVEFLSWGPLDADGHPIESRKGETFAAFLACLTTGLDPAHPAWSELEAWFGPSIPRAALVAGLGYVVEWRELRGCDFGAPTTRERLFLVARCDGQPIAWPEPSHGQGDGLLPYRTAAECIDLCDLGESMLDRTKPHAEETCKRIAAGVMRFVVDNPKRFLVGAGSGRCADHRDRAALFIAKHYTGVVGHELDRPLGTITAIDHHALVAVKLTPRDDIGAGDGRPAIAAAFLTKYYGTGSVGQPIDVPMHTIRAGACFALVTVIIDAAEWVITDIRMRMLQVPELAEAQGLGRDYRLTGTQRQRIARIGNSVCPQVAGAVIAANLQGSPMPKRKPARRVATVKDLGDCSFRSWSTPTVDRLAAALKVEDPADITDEQWEAFDREEAAAGLAAAAPSLPMEGVTIDEQLRRAMGKDERSLRVIAAAADIPHVSLYDWTKGKGRLPLTYADRLARVLGFELVLQRVPGETP